MYRLPPRPRSNQGSKNFTRELRAATEPLRSEEPIPEFRELVLGLALLKCVCSTFEAHRKGLDAMFRDPKSRQYLPAERERQVALNTADTFRRTNGFFVPLFAAWRRIEATATERPERLGRLIEVAMTAVERENPELQGIFPASYAGRVSDETLAALVRTISGLYEGLRSSDPAEMAQQARRSEERRVGKECSELCRSRWSPYH